MARTDPERAAEFGRNLTDAHKAAGAPSFGSLGRLAAEAFGIYAPTDETIRLYHRGKQDPLTADLILVCFLAIEYGVTLSDLHPMLAERFNMTRGVYEHTSPCIAA